MYATSRDPAKRERIAALGATALEPGARLPERVGVVIETVGAATFDHSLKCTAPGARIVVSGTTAGHLATVDLRRVFAMQLEILRLVDGDGRRAGRAGRPRAPAGCGRSWTRYSAFSDVREAFEKLHRGDVFGKIVLDHTR